nr:DUF3168 domain-containing protein [Sphingomonas xinjiangensis]
MREAFAATYPAGGDPAKSVFPLVAPKGKTAPFITYTRSSASRLYDLEGAVGVASPTFRVDAYASGYLEARKLANSIRIKLDGYDDAEVHNVELVQERDLSDLTSSPDLFRIQLEFRITHNEETGD